MHTLYDSETYSVTHMLAQAEPVSAPDPALEARFPQGVPLLARHGFEIIDKRSGKEVYLEGSWAELFQRHIVAWQVNIPSQQEVEDTLEQFAELAQTPVLIH
ncbi:MAG: BTH_I0359 family protein [Rhodoferax sp.]